MGAVLAVSFGLLWLHVAVRRRPLGFGALSRRGALVLAFVAFEVLVLAVTELSSLGHRYTRGVATAWWVVVAVVLAVAAVPPLRARLAAIRSTGGVSSRVRARLGVLSVEDRLWLLVLMAIGAVLAYLGFRYLPSNGDSLVYHLARIEHWTENRTVAPFATHYLPQVEFTPLAEYTIAQLHLLGGADQVDAAVALTAAVVTVVGASELARLLGAGRSVQIAAAVICATVPSFVLLATSTENDVFAAAVGMALLIVLMAQTGGVGWPGRAAVLGVTAGLGYLTKATIPLMLLPAALAVLGLAVYRRRAALRRRFRHAVGSAAGWLAVVVAGAVVIAGPFVVQEMELFGSPVGPSSASSSSSPLTLEAGAADVIRNVANDFHIGNGHSGWQYELSRTVLPALHGVFDRLHIAEGDARYSVTPTLRAFSVTDYSASQTDEASGADPLMLMLIVVGGGALAVSVLRGNRRLRTALTLSVGLGAGYLLFTAIAKWGLWDGRYDVLLLAAWSPLVALALSRTRAWVTTVVLVVLVATCLPQLVDSSTRPLVPSASFEASYRSSYLAPYLFACCSNHDASDDTEVTAVLARSSCRFAGIANWILMEYPLWVALRHDDWAGRLDAVDVPNQTAGLQVTGRTCAFLRQATRQQVTPDNGMVNVQSGTLALSIDPTALSSGAAHQPRFTSSVHGTEVFAGAGWALAALFGDPVLVGHGSLYLVSSGSHRVRLVLRPVPHYPEPTLTVTGPGGTSVPVATGATGATVGLRPGITRLDLTVAPGLATQRRLLPLESVSIAPAGR